jgi:hypothetical protein
MALALFVWMPTLARQQSAGSIEGAVQRAGTDTPIEGANVTLARMQGDLSQNVNVISDARGGFAFRDLDLFKSAVSSLDGRFMISSIPPGDYKIFAWDAIEPYSWFDPDVLTPFEEMGTAVRVESSGNLSIQLKLFVDKK